MLTSLGEGRVGDAGHFFSTSLTGCTCLLPSVVEQFGEFLHDLRRRLHAGGTLPSEQVGGPGAAHRPVVIGEGDEVGHGRLPLVLLQLPAVLHQQLRDV